MHVWRNDFEHVFLFWYRDYKIFPASFTEGPMNKTPETLRKKDREIIYESPYYTANTISMSSVITLKITIYVI